MDTLVVPDPLEAQLDHELTCSLVYFDERCCDVAEWRVRLACLAHGTRSGFICEWDHTHVTWGCPTSITCLRCVDNGEPGQLYLVDKHRLR